MVKKVSKKKDLYLTLLNLLNKNIPPSHIDSNGNEKDSICAILHITKQNLSYHLKKLKNERCIKKSGKIWQVKKTSLGTIEKPTTNLHALQIKFPILSGKIKDSDWEIKEKLNHWIPKYKQLDALGSLTVKNNNNKSITVWAKSRNIKTLDEVNNLAFKIRTYIHQYFKNKHDVVLDVFNCETKNLDLGTEDKHSKSMLKKGEKFKLDLNKKSEKIFKKDNIDAKAWIDGTPFEFTAETNDLEWKREYLSMPFNMKNTLKLVHYIAQNYASHVRLVEKASKVMDKLDKKLSIKKKNIKSSKSLKESQTTLGDY